jgi:flagellin FlaB
MFDTDKPEERGQVGIGTLIVFIALVLVAAIAAGVLINTAGFLQSQAESTGQESTDQVSNGLQVVTASGDGSGGSIDALNIDVKLRPGSDPVNMSNVRISVTGDASATIDGSDLTFTTDPLTDTTDTATISISSVSLSSNDQVEVLITTADGSQTTKSITVPDPLPAEKIRL